MLFTKFMRHQTCLCFIVLLFSMPALSSATGLNDLLGKKEINEDERKETIEKIQSIEQKLKLLQDKLRVLERRKAAKAAAQRAEELGHKFSDTPAQVNWVAVDETTVALGDYGLYTYLLFNGNQENSDFIGLLEDFILTIETLPVHDIPSSLANQFLIPVEKPQSMINLGRQPYDFKLNQAYLKRLGIVDELPTGPILVSSREPVDPYGTGDITDFIAVGLGKQAPARSAELASLWHQQEKNVAENSDHEIAGLFWQLIYGIGPVQVSRNKQHISVSLPQ
jgi:hypothetical protein